MSTRQDESNELWIFKQMIEYVHPGVKNYFYEAPLTLFVVDVIAWLSRWMK